MWNELWRLRLEPNETSVAIRAEGHRSQEHVSFIIQKADVLALLNAWGLMHVEPGIKGKLGR
jgi:hypothetical protein